MREARPGTMRLRRFSIPNSVRSSTKKRGRRAKAEYDARTHKLRIALKKLRYAAEFFAPLYGRRRATRYIRTLKSLLDELGAANDSHGVGDVLALLGQADE